MTPSLPLLCTAVHFNAAPSCSQAHAWSTPTCVCHGGHGAVLFPSWAGYCLQEPKG